MKKLKISGFDLGVIIAFVVVALLGGGAWWYLSGALQDAVTDVTNAKSDFDKYSTKYDIVVSPSNGATMQANIDLLKAQLDPLIHTKLLPEGNKLNSIDKEDPVAWKHDLDDDVHRLNGAAKVHGVSVPPNYYFGFSRYLGQSPSDEQTPVLSKQLVGIDQLATILINAPVKGIQAIRRTYEEDPHVAGNTPISESEPDRLGGYSLNSPGNNYTVYPFEIDFETTSENLRPILNNLIQSPYIFVVRTLSIQNDHPNSPVMSDLDRIIQSGATSTSVVDTSPGEVGATPASTLGPQYLFGNSVLKIKARIDMIEWNAAPPASATPPSHNPTHQNTPPTGAP